MDIINGEFNLLSSPCESYDDPYDGKYWTLINCYIKLQRRPLFYIFNLGLPIVLLLGIGGLIFCLPPDSGDKISLSVTVFLALAVFLMLVMETIPSTSLAVPLLGEYVFSY